MHGIADVLGRAFHSDSSCSPSLPGSIMSSSSRSGVSPALTSFSSASPDSIARTSCPAALSTAAMSADMLSSSSTT